MNGINSEKKTSDNVFDYLVKSKEESNKASAIMPFPKPPPGPPQSPDSDPHSPPAMSSLTDHSARKFFSRCEIKLDFSLSLRMGQKNRRAENGCFGLGSNDTKMK